MTVRSGTALKCLIPGYRAIWRARAALFLREIVGVAGEFSFGWDGDVPIAVRKGGPTIAGFVTPDSDRELFHLLRGALPNGLDEGHFRLARDLVTRYRYPHLRPDLAPDGGRPPNGLGARMTGFHGQHKDTALHIADPERRDRFVTAFRPKPEDRILDCGAFIGIGDIACAPLVPQGRIVALEADPRCFALLKRNVTGYEIGNVDICHGAIWNRDGEEMDFSTGDAQANTLVHSVHDGGGRNKVRTRTVDGLVDDFRIDRLTMLSLTVNGAEVEALQGAARTLERDKPRIRLAGWYRRDGRSVAELCQPVLEAAGYDVHIGPGLGVLAVPAQEAGR